MTIIATIMAALTLLGYTSSTIDSLNFDKRNYHNVMRTAIYDQNRYCTNFIKSLESNDAIEDFTNVTVLTHGWGSSYKDWLPKTYDSSTQSASNKYLCTNYSLPFLLSGLSSQTNSFVGDFNTSIYVFEPNDHYFYEYISNPTDTTLKQLQYKNGSFTFNSVNDIKIEDINNKKIVLLYNGTSNEFNYTVEQCAKRFEACLSNVLCRIYNAQFATLGKINLIGHSKGGLVNLLYSTRHPKLVNNLISLGTPYEGSSWASVLHAIEEMEYIATGDPSDEQEVLNYDDLLNPNHPSEFSSLFNARCSNINSFALGFNMTPSALIYSVIDACRAQENRTPSNYIVPMSVNLASQMPTYLKTYIQNKFGGGPVLEIITSLVTEYYKHAINTAGHSIDSFAGALINGLIELIDPIVALFKEAVRKAKTVNDLAKSICDFFGGNGTLDKNSLIMASLIHFADSTRKVFNDARVLYTGDFGIIKSDVCVNTDSQLGLNYYNFDRRDTLTISPISADNCYDYYHCARPEQPAVPHNFEVMNPDAVNRIRVFLNSHNGLETFNISSVNIYKTLNMAIFVREEDGSFIKEGLITPSMYNYPDYYVYERDLVNNPSRGIRNFTAGDFNVTTSVLRTGYIQSEKLVMSPDRKDAGAAYIEFTLDKPAFKVAVDLSLWSSKENQNHTHEKLLVIDNPYTLDAIKSESLFTNKVCNSMTEYIVENLYWDLMQEQSVQYRSSAYTRKKQAQDGLLNAFSVNVNDLSRNRNSTDYYEFVFDKPTTRFGFFAAVKNITGQSSNKGRICLNNLRIYG